MQEQNFEKQVRQKMEELSLTPSTPVWQKVEQEIRQKKRRRRLVIIWLAPFILAGAGLLVWHTLPSLQKDQSLSKPVIDSLSLKTTPVPSVQQQSATIETANTTDTATATANTISEAVSKPNPSAAPFAVIPSTPSTLRKEAISSSLPTVKQYTKGKSATDINLDRQGTPTENLTTSATQHTIQKEGDITITNFTNEEVSLKDSSSTIYVIKPVTELIASPQKTPTALFVPVESITDTVPIQRIQRKVAKWSFAVQVAYGIASTQKALLSPAVYAADYASSPTPSSGGQFNGSPSTPSPIDKGSAIGLGFLAKRKISDRFNLSTGIGYHRFSTRIQIGQQIVQDTTLQLSFRLANLSSYYRNDRNVRLENYTNNYHFIEIPMALEWQPIRRLPLNWQAGFNLSYLFATNALIYDPSANIYYKNEDLYSKLQLHFQSGLTYRIWKNQLFGVHVGPYLQYGLTGLQKEKGSSNYHLLSTGLKAQISL
jgi:hypothetical protein